MEKIQAHMIGEVISSNSEDAFSLADKSSFGEKVGEKIQYSVAEAVYLVEKDKMELTSKGKKIPKKEVIEKLKKIDNKVQIKYPVFKDLRDRGYILKTALKFGADFRVYDKGTKPGDKHARWILFVAHESQKLTWHDFSAKNRIANSVKKNLLLGIVDEEGDVTYYEVKWIKP